MRGFFKKFSKSGSVFDVKPLTRVRPDRSNDKIAESETTQIRLGRRKVFKNDLMRSKFN